MKYMGSEIDNGNLSITYNDIWVSDTSFVVVVCLGLQFSHLNPIKLRWRVPSKLCPFPLTKLCTHKMKRNINIKAWKICHRDEMR